MCKEMIIAYFKVLPQLEERLWEERREWRLHPSIHVKRKRWWKMKITTLEYPWRD
jgi:hypothetical protein